MRVHEAVEPDAACERLQWRPVVQVPVCRHLDDTAGVQFRHRNHPFGRCLSFGVGEVFPSVGAVGDVVHLRVMVHEGVVVFLI